MMNDFRIITDSGADLTDEMRAELGAEEMIPFYLTIANEVITTDHTLSIPVLLSKMKACTEKMTSSCADPEAWKSAFEKAKNAFAITIASSLSGTYAAASAGLSLAKEKTDCVVHIFDSQTAVSGETLLAYKLREFINEGLTMPEIIKNTEAFIQKMKTYFILDDISNLVKNGRLSHITGTIVQILGIKPILGEKNGKIELFDKVRGYKNIADKMVLMIAKSGRVIDGDDFIISHCNNYPLAKEIVDKARAQFNFGNMRIIDMQGISSFYASDKGICMSF
jgi:DegV family protein with EDD domain